jgi:hypothetical protein
MIIYHQQNKRMNSSISNKCIFCNYEKGHTIETCNYAILRAKDLYKELIILIINHAPLRIDEELYVLNLIERYISKRDVDALISFHYSDLQKYIQEEQNEYFENERLIYSYLRKTYLLSCYYYKNAFAWKFKIEEDFPKKCFQIKTKIISEMNVKDTFDCPICLSTVKNDLCIIYENCKHKVCSDCFYEMTKNIENTRIKQMKCCLCRNIVKTISFVDEFTQINMLSKYT